MSTNAENVAEVVERAACGAIVERASARRLFLASAALMTMAASAAESADLQAATLKKVLGAAAYSH